MITERMQANLLYRKYIADNKSIQIDESLLTEPWRTILRETERYIAEYGPLIPDATPADHLVDGIRSVCGIGQDYEERFQHLIDTIYAAAAPMRFPNLAELAAKLEPITWLWENWIPRGMLTMVGAYQGTGKSYLTMDIARTVLHGPAWPDGVGIVHDPADARVVYVDAEGIPQVNSQRATAMSVDTRRVYLLTAAVGEMLDLTNQTWRDRLLDLCNTVQPALVIIDSLNAVTSTSTKSVEDVNALLSYLAGLARYFNTSVLVVHHLRKPGGGQMMLPGVSIHDFMGSGHITAMMRSVIGMSVGQRSGRQFSLNGPRRIEIVKTNLTPTYPNPLSVTLEQPDADHIRFTYAAVDDTDTADDKPDPETWLIDYLETNGPTPYRDILAEAEAADINRTALYRARKKLGARVIDSKGKHAGGNQWLLAEQAAELTNETDGEQSDTMDAPSNE